MSVPWEDAASPMEKASPGFLSLQRTVSRASENTWPGLSPGVVRLTHTSCCSSDPEGKEKSRSGVDDWQETVAASSALSARTLRAERSPATSAAATASTQRPRNCTGLIAVVVRVRACTSSCSLPVGWI